MQHTWSEIESALGAIAKVSGGFTLAHRGIITLRDGTRIFVKIGVDDSTKAWAAKEVETYRFLARSGYPFIPSLLAYNKDKTSFAIELLAHDDGWDWQDAWTDGRLAATLQAMDDLAAVEVTGANRALFSTPSLSEENDGWRALAESPKLQQLLRAKLQAAGQVDLAGSLNIAAEAQRSAQFDFAADVLVHNDVRADNCAWNSSLHTAKLVDWSWTQLGDRRIDLAAMLAHVHKTGFNVLPGYASRLDAGALHWIAGFWFKRAITRLRPGAAPHLRDLQLASGLVALELAAQV